MDVVLLVCASSGVSANILDNCVLESRGKSRQNKVKDNVDCAND